MRSWVVILILLFFSVLNVTGQRTSKDNYTGGWETSTSWNPTWATPISSGIDFNINIYGYITRTGGLSFSGGGGDLNVYDTLIVNGNVDIGNNNNLNVFDHAVLIIRGNLTVSNKVDISANAYIVITGDFTKSGSGSWGSFTSNDDPPKVFIGGTVNLPNNPDTSAFSVLNCGTNLYPESGCNYGNITDLTNDTIFNFFTSTCTSTPTIFNVTGGGSYCNGGSGVAIGLSGSTSGIVYRLYRGATLINSVTGTGSAVSFGNQTVNGTYSAKAFNLTTGCSSNMSGSATVTILTVPTAPAAITGTEVVCQGISNIGYSVAAVSGATNYVWTYSGSGATITGTTNSVAISFSASATSGNLSVAAQNSCGTGSSSPYFPITVIAVPITNSVQHIKN